MKQLKTQRLKYLVTFFTVLFMSMVQANDNVSDLENDFGIRYDKVSDHLSVSYESGSLKFLLRKVAKHSGIEVQFDDLVDEQVTVNVNADSLERGLKQILKGRNYSFRYSKDENGKPLLVAVTVLPVGEHGNGQARKLVPIEAEAYYRGWSQLSHEQVQHMDLIEQRWRSRLEIMRPGQREKVMEIVSARLLEKAKSEQQQKERKLKREQRERERVATRKQEIEQAWKGVSSEKRAAFEKQSNVSGEYMRELIHHQQ